MSEPPDFPWTEEDPTAEAEIDPAKYPDPSAKAPDRTALAQAVNDLEAAKARVGRDAKRVADEMREKLVLQLLPVVDNVDRTIAAAGENGDAPAVVEGVRLVRAQLDAVLRGYGVERIDALDQRFDPAIHEAVSMVSVPRPASHGRVIDQLEPGYRFGSRLLRPAKVVVGRFTEETKSHVSRWH